jgi:ATP-dependent Clp protease ATP-binding subunit ClpA
MIFNQSVRTTFEDSNKYAKEHHHEFITPEHVLRTILDQHPGIYEGVAEKAIIKDIDDYLDTAIPKTEKDPLESSAFQVMANKAAQCAMNSGKEETNLADVLAGIWNTKCQGHLTLKAYNINKDHTIAAAKKLQEPTNFNKDGNSDTFCKDIGSFLMLLGWALYNGKPQGK